MAEPAVISLVVDLIVAAFDSDIDLFNSWLVRSRLETEAAALESEMRVVEAERDAGITAAADELQTLQAALNTKLAEIDAL